MIDPNFTVAQGRYADELVRKVARLQAALLEWKCPSCGGTKVYRSGDPRTVPVPCKVCCGTGLHPTASEALK